MSGRRELSFARLDEVMPEVDRLLAGHETVGRWSLGQICNHLATGVRLSFEAGPGPAGPPAPKAEAVRRLFFRRGRFPGGIKAPHPLLLPAADLDARTEADSLRAALERFVAAEGPLFSTHPALGTLTKDEWSRFHCIHSAHHLGFASPVIQGGLTPGIDESDDFLTQDSKGEPWKKMIRNVQFRKYATYDQDKVVPETMNE